MIQDIALKLYRYAKDRDFSGWDPYDGLNSLLFKATPFNRIMVCRLAWIQFFKRCPINFRPVFLVPKGRNPKGIALFASTALNLFKLTGDNEYRIEAKALLDWLQNNYSKGFSGHAWGYNFTWQARNNLFPEFFPTIVTTSFVAGSFLDGYDITGNKELLDVAESAAAFILKDFYVYREDGGAAYGYGPSDKSCVYNATALGGQFFARLYKETGKSEYRGAAESAIKFVVSRQQNDGSWLYGDHSTQKWIDSFHTGYNLTAIKTYQEYTGDPQYQKAIDAGFSFYQKECFTASGEPKYYSNSFYPIDVHACAVAILMFTEFGFPERAREIVDWTISKLWNKKGYFDYQITRHYRNSIPYMRWSQAWMLYALSEFLKSAG